MSKDIRIKNTKEQLIASLEKSFELCLDRYQKYRYHVFEPITNLYCEDEVAKKLGINILDKTDGKYKVSVIPFKETHKLTLALWKTFLFNIKLFFVRLKRKNQIRRE